MKKKLQSIEKILDFLTDNEIDINIRCWYGCCPNIRFCADASKDKMWFEDRTLKVVLNQVWDYLHEGIDVF